MKHPEFNRLRGKSSYRGKSLQDRIKLQTKEVDRARQHERDVKKIWFRSQIELMSAEDELALMYQLANAEHAAALKAAAKR